MRSYKLNSKSDMRRFKRDLQKELVKEFEKSLKKAKFTKTTKIIIK